MPISLATKLGIQFARFAAASGNVGSAGLRGAFNNASAGSTSTASSTWAQGLSSGGASSANGAGLGGAKFQAGRGAHSTFSQSGRAIVNANASGSHDGANSIGDDEEELAVQQAWIHRPGHLHRSGLLGRQLSQSRARLSTRTRETTTLPALQLMLPRSNQLLITNGPSQARALSTTSAGEAVDLSQTHVPVSSIEDASTTSSSHATSRLGRSRSHSVNATTSTDHRKDEPLDLPSLLGVAAKASPADQASVQFSAEREQQERSNEEWDMIKALRTENDDIIKVAVQQYRKLDRSKLSVAGMNRAIECLVKIGQRDARMETIADILSCYLQMIEHDMRPNVRTWEMMVVALTVRDAHLFSLRSSQARPGTVSNGQGESDGDEFQQAIAIFNLAHASSSGFFSIKPYNSLLFSCQLRSDSRQACDILEFFAKNDRVQPNSSTFTFLMQCIAKDKRILPGEDEEATRRRILASLIQIFEEFESRRASPSWRHESTYDAHLWNTMIEACFDLGDSARAMDLIAKMADGNAAQSSGVPPPYPTRRTAALPILKLLEQGDITGAASWFDHLLKLHNAIGQVYINSAIRKDEGESDNHRSGQSSSDDLSSSENPVPQASGRPIIPMPDFSVCIALIDHITASIDREALHHDNPHQAALEFVGNLRTANRALHKAFWHFRRDSFGTPLGRLHASTCNMLTCNSAVAMGLIRIGKPEEMSDLLDDALSFVHLYFKYEPSSKVGSDGKITEKEARRKLRISRSVTATIPPLELVDRLQDATSAFTYAVASSMLGPDQRITLPQSMFRAAALQASALYDVFLGLMGQEVRSSPHKPPSAPASQRLILSVEMSWPSLKSHGWDFNENDCERLMQLYVQTRQEHEPKELPFSAAGWNLLAEACLKLEAKKGYDPEENALTFLTDLSTLAEDVRSQLDINELARIVLSKYPSSATDILQAINPALPALKGSMQADDVSESAASTNIESLLEGYTTSPSSVGDAAQASWPAVQLIDDDLSGQLEVQNAGRRGRLNAITPADPEGAFARLMSSIEETGTYPSINAICSMLVSAGRGGEGERIHQLYSIGCHIVASMGGDLEWQAWSWSQLENSMITGLAHAGEAKAASEHRHRLINAGRVPDVNAYAALIAVVRDTTDDALIAEELYKESQRLGVEPNVYLYNTVISKLCRARKLERAMQLFDEMRQRGLHPSSVTYGALINGCTRTGDEASAEQLFAFMESDGNFRPQAPPFNTMIQFYTYTKPDRSKALFYFHKLQERKVAPTAHTYKLLLDVYGTVEPVDVAGMEHVFGQLIADGRTAVQGNHWASIITAHGVHRFDLDKALEIFEDIPSHVSSRAPRQDKSRARLPDAVTYEALLNVLLAHDRTDLMQAYIERMRKSGIHPTAYVANLMIKGLAAQQCGGDAEAQRHALEQARAFFEEMSDPPMGVAAVGNHPPNHRHHANGVHTPGSDAVATDSTEGSGGTYGFQGVLREPSTFETMIRVELSHGNAQKARDLVERMKHRGYPPALISKAYALLDGEVHV